MKLAITDKNKMREGNISLILDSYDDIFSDFDPRSYIEKTLSDDFLHECNKMSKYKNEPKLYLRLLVPSDKRNATDEEMIKSRLKSHFVRHYHEHLREEKNSRKQGILWFLLGAVIVFSAANIHSISSKSIWYNLLLVILEPAGWFTIWNGLDKLFLYKDGHELGLAFYKKMHNADIEFFSY